MKKIFQQFIQELQALWVMITGRFIKASFKRAADRLKLTLGEVGSKVSIGLLVAFEFLKVSIPYFLRTCYQKIAHVLALTWQQVAQLKSVILFIRHEWFAFISLLTSSTTILFNEIWRVTPQRLKPYLLPIFPYFRQIKQVWLWINHIALVIVRIVLKDLLVSYVFLRDLLKRKAHEYHLDTDSLKDYRTQFVEEFSKAEILIKAKQQLRLFHIVLEEHWDDFKREWRSISDRVAQLRRSRPSLQSIEVLSPYSKEKRDVIATSIIINVLALAFPLFMLQLYDRILPHQSIDTLLLFGLVVGVAVLLESIIRVVRSSLSSWIAARFEHSAMMALTDRYLAEPLSQFERKGTGAIMEDYKSIATLKYHYSGQTFQQLMDLPFTIIYIFIVLIISPWVGLLLLVGYTIFVFITWKHGQEAPSLSKQQKEGDLRRSNFLNEILKNIHTLKSMTMESMMERRYERLQETCAKLMSRMSYFTEMSAGIGNVFSPVMTILVTALGAFLVINNRMTNGELAACILLGMRSLAPLQRLGGIWTKFQQDSILRDKLAGIIKKPGLPLASYEDLDQEASPNTALSGMKGAGIELSNIHFTFQESKKLIFDELSLKIDAGEFVVITGESGSGRSTLLQIMSGILVPDKGKIALNVDDIQSLNPIELSNRVAYLPQKAVLFDGSLLDNITIFDSDRIEIALQAAKELGLSDFVAKLPRGWDTPVGDMTADSLSPGYRQRIAIIRALSSSPNVILFDNASSAIDAEGDALLLRFIEAIKGKITLVMVSQRPVFQKLAHRTLHLAEGKISQAGEGPPPAPGSGDEFHFLVDIDGNTSSANDPRSNGLPSGYRPVPLAEFFELKKIDDVTESKHWEYMHSMVGANFREPTDFANCLVLLLKLLYSRYTAREVAESLPYYTENLDLAGLQNSMALLGYSVAGIHCQLGDLDVRSLPCLFVPDDNIAAFVVVGKSGKNMRVGVDAIDEARLEPNLGMQGSAYFYKKEDISQTIGKSWTANVLWRFMPTIGQAGVSALVLGLVTIASSIFLMVVYSTVIPSGSNLTLWYLAAGALIATFGSFYFIRHRAHLLAYIAGRIEFLFGTSILRHLLRMPPSYTERASVGSQISRIQSFEGIRDLFTGALASTILESPATLVLLIALSFMNPIALLIFTAMVTVYTFLYWAFYREANKRSSIVGRTSNKRSEFLIEMVGKMRQVRESGAQYLWLERFKDISAEASMAGFKAEQISSMLVGISYFVMMIAALLIVALTVPAVFAQTLGAGALMVSMMLMWRVLSPFQTIFTSMNRIERVRGAIRQIDVLMSIQGERSESAVAPMSRGTQGRIEFSRVSFRYSPNADPALIGVEFKINPGDMVAITGANGGGKSTVLKMLLGLYQPQAGSILIDNVDIRQLDPYALRRMIGYAPQDPHFFRASIAQNLRLARPDATDNEVFQALEMAGALRQVLALPRGLDFRLGDNMDEIPFGLKQKILLARTFITRAPIMLFDEPGAGLDNEGDAKLLEALKVLKGKSTVIYVSHRPSHILMADTLLVFDKGYLRAAAPPADILKPPPLAA